MTALMGHTFEVPVITWVVPELSMYPIVPDYL
jgi:hypothetical protein